MCKDHLTHFVLKKEDLSNPTLLFNLHLSYSANFFSCVLVVLKKKIPHTCQLSEALLEGVQILLALRCAIYKIYDIKYLRHKYF